MPPFTQVQIPIVILAGSDRRSGPVPEGGESLHFFVGYKGAEIQFGGRPLAAWLVDRLRESNSFSSVYLAGPRRVYEGLVGCEIIDTDGAVDRNIFRAEQVVRERHGNECRVAFIACDVFPSVEDIAQLTRELLSDDAPDASGRVPPPAALAIALCTPRESDLGASAWKPRYRVRVTPGEDPVPFYPGHLAIAWPSRLRTGCSIEYCISRTSIATRTSRTADEP